MTNFTEKNEIEIFKWRFIGFLAIGVALLFVLLFWNKCRKPPQIQHITKNSVGKAHELQWWDESRTKYIFHLTNYL